MRSVSPQTSPLLASFVRGYEHALDLNSWQMQTAAPLHVLQSAAPVKRCVRSDCPASCVCQWAQFRSSVSPMRVLLQILRELCNTPLHLVQIRGLLTLEERIVTFSGLELSVETILCWAVCTQTMFWAALCGVCAEWCLCAEKSAEAASDESSSTGYLRSLLFLHQNRKERKGKHLACRAWWVKCVCEKKRWISQRDLIREEKKGWCELLCYYKKEQNDFFEEKKRYPWKRDESLWIKENCRWHE